MGMIAHRFSVQTLGGEITFFAEGIDCPSVSAGMIPVMNTVFGASAPHNFGGCSGSFATVGSVATVTVWDKWNNSADLSVTRLQPDFDSVGYLLLIAAVVVIYALGFVGGQQR